MKDLIKTTIVFAAGAAVGAAVAMLLTPKTGEDIRTQLRDLAEDAKKRAQDYCEQVKKDLTEAQAPAAQPANEEA